MSQKIDIEKLKKMVIDGVQGTIEQMCKMSCESNPDFQEVDIIEYNSRLRVVPLEKFNGPCYIASINFYLDQKKYDADIAVGAMIVFFEENIALDMLAAVSKGMDDDDESVVMDNCGEICNVLVGQFKNKIKDLGYKDVIMSAPAKYKNDVPGGVSFKYSETKIFQLNFNIDGKKAIVVETTLAPPP